MKYYRKRNIYHPVLTVNGAPIPWQRVGTSGVLATEDPDTVALLDLAAKESRGAVQVLTEDEFKSQSEPEKKTQSQQPRRTFPTRVIGEDASRSRVQSPKSATPPSGSPPPAAAPAVSAAKKKVGRPARVAAGAPVVEPPPGVTGIAQPDEPEPA
jgi:cell division protein FtsN